MTNTLRINAITIEVLEDLDNTTKINGVSHDIKGGFHLDEQICALLHAKSKNLSHYKLLATRDMILINQAKLMDGVLVYDVGHGKLDHHQKDAKKRHDGVKYAAASLVYEELGFEGGLVLKTILNENDNTDNGVVLDKLKFEILFDLIRKSNSQFEELNYNPNLHFAKVFEILCLIDIHSDDIEGSITEIKNSSIYKEYITERNAEHDASQSRIESALSNAEKVGNTLIFDKYFPADSLIDSGYESVIFLGGNGQWSVQGVPKSKKEWNIPLKSFPTEFAGLRNEELISVSGMEGAIFSLPFISFFEKKENAINALKFMV